MKTVDDKLLRVLQLGLGVALASVILAGAGKQTQAPPNAADQSTPLIRLSKGPIFSAPIAPRATAYQAKEQALPCPH
jgi:hypothetical protein